MSPIDPDSTVGARSSSSSVSPGRNLRAMDTSGTPESSFGMAMMERFSSRSSNRSGAAARTNAIRSASGSIVIGGRPATGQPDDVGPLRGDGEQPVAVACDEKRYVRDVFAHVLGHVAQMVDALSRRRERQFGLLELLLDVPGAKPQFETSAAEVAQRGDVTGQ